MLRFWCVGTIVLIAPPALICAASMLRFWCVGAIVLIAPPALICAASMLRFLVRGDNRPDCPSRTYMRGIKNGRGKPLPYAI